MTERFRDKKEESSKKNEEKEVKEEDVNCPECSSNSLHEDCKRGEIVCSDCGVVIEDDVIDYGPDWRAFNKEESDKKRRVGPPISNTRHDKGLTTQIDWKDKDASGNSISQDSRHKMKRLRKHNKRSKAKNSKEKNLREALSEIERMVSALRLPDNTKELACTMYRRVLDEDMVRGRSIEGVASSCLYIACKMNNIPRSLDEIEKISRVDKNEISSTYRYIQGEMSIEIEPVDPKSYIPRFCSKLELSKGVENKAMEIAEKTMNKGLLSGKSPTGFAAAAIYAAGLYENEKKTQEEIAEVADVTEVTIRNRYQEQVKNVSDI